MRRIEPPYLLLIVGQFGTVQFGTRAIELILPKIRNKTFHLINFKMIKQYLEQILGLGVFVCPVGHKYEEKESV